MHPEPEEFSLERRREGGRLLVVVRGELDLATAPALEGVLLEALDAGDRVVLDVHDLAFMDSSGVRALVSAYVRAGRDGERFAVVRPGRGSEVARIIDVSGLDAELRLLDDPAEF
jgi:anti-sigma B factor antagonist